MAWVLINDLISLLQDFMDFIISKQRVLYCKTQTVLKQHHIQKYHSFILAFLIYIQNKHCDN